MKKFLYKSIIFISLVFGGIIMLFNYYGGYIDYFYPKFTTQKQFSFILGDSRAFQGIHPKEFDVSLMSSNFKLPSYNFSFTIAQTAYGPSYLDAIKRKLDTLENNQLFVVTVNPWMLANRTPKEEKESDEIFEDSPPHNMKNMSSNPNIEYLIKNRTYSHFKSIFRKKSKTFKDGHRENYNLPPNEKVFNKWREVQRKMFIDFSEKYTVSEFRLEWLRKTVSYLKQYGSVVLVRLPIDNEILEVENDFWDDFDSNIKYVSLNTNTTYLNFSKESKWSTYDGHHLDKKGAILFSKELGENIKKINF